MSARGYHSGSRQRRSSSLTSLTSRPSIGVAQRVSGAAFDRVRSSGGASGSKLSGVTGSTLKRHGSLSALSNPSASKQRQSSAGGSSCLKDTRPLSDRMYRERMVRALVDFLSAHRYPHQINLKTANGPSTADFRKIFEFLVCHLQPNFKIGPKLDESVMTALRFHGYPFTISKSHLSTIGVQHTWPPVLAALSYLRVCIESVERADVESLLTRVDENGQRIAQDEVHERFVETAYAAFLNGADDDDLKPLIADLEKKLESCSVQCTDMEMLEQETELNRQKLAQLESQPNELVSLENENEAMLLDIERLEQYIAGIAKHNSEKEANMCAISEELKQKVMEKDALASEVQKMTHVASNQRVSGVDAQRINSQLAELRTQFNQCDKDLSDLDRELNAEEQLHSQEKMSLAANVAEYNKFAQMLQLIPLSAANAHGFDYEMTTDLTQDESTRTETEAMPALRMLSQRVTEKCREREDEVTKMKEAVEQISELNTDCRHECTSLINAITATDNKLEQAKETNAVKIQQWQDRIDEANNMIELRKNTYGALERGRQQLQAAKDRLEAKRKELQEKEDTYCRHILRVADLIAKYKSNMKEQTPKMAEEILALLSAENGVEHE